MVCHSVRHRRLVSSAFISMEWAFQQHWTCIMRLGKSYLKHINFTICLARSLQNQVYSPCRERPPVLRDHKNSDHFIQALLCINGATPISYTWSNIISWPAVSKSPSCLVCCENSMPKFSVDKWEGSLIICHNISWRNLHSMKTNWMQS